MPNRNSSHPAVDVGGGGVIARIEGLIKSEAKIENQSNYKITTLGKKEFGGTYLRQTYKVMLRSGKLKDIVSFTEKLTQGDQPLILERLDMVKKSRMGSEEIEANMHVSSITKNQ